MSDSSHPRLAPKHLGQPSELPASPDAAVLDYVPNPRGGDLYLVRFAAPAFSSNCPVTGQPDFAHLVIDYAPGATLVQSKSLTQHLSRFRGPAGFPQDCPVAMGPRLFYKKPPTRLRTSR